MQPIGDGNKYFDKTILADLNQFLKIENIHITNNYPCVLDED